jgi:hypothetical protein
MLPGKPMSFKDEEIEKLRAVEQSRTAAAKRDAAEKRAYRQEFKAKAKTAKRAKDRVGFERLLELYDVKRGSDRWRICWEYFYSDET